MTLDEWKAKQAKKEGPSFPQVELGTLFLGFPFVQGHLLLLLFPSKLCLQLFGSEFSGSLGLLLNGGDFFLAFRVDSCVRLLTLLRHIILKGSPVTLATASSLVFSLDSSSVVSRLPVIVPLAAPAATLSTSTATTATTSFSSTATSTHLASAA